jgi:hypothetical protein
VEAFNETDPRARSELVREAFEPGGALIEAAARSNGWSNVEERLEREQTDLEHSVEIVAPVKSRGREAWTRVEHRSAAGGRRLYVIAIRIGSEGERISRAVMSPAQHPNPSVWRRSVDAMAGNPLAVAGIVGGAAYLALRIPTQVFYARLGTTPDEVGFGPETLLPQSLRLLALAAIGGALAYPFAKSKTVLSARAMSRMVDEGKSFHGVLAMLLAVCLFIGVAVGLAWLGDNVLLASGDPFSSTPDEPPSDLFVLAIAFFIIAVATVTAPRASVFLTGGGKTLRLLAAERRRRRDRWQSRSTFAIGALSTAVVFLVVLSIIGYSGGSHVRDGGEARGSLFPWRAVPASVDWRPIAAKADVPESCGELRYLGTASGRDVLFDTRADRIVRVPTPDASISTNLDCLWISVDPERQERRCTGHTCKHEVHVFIDVSDHRAQIEGLLKVSNCDSARCWYRRVGPIDSNDLVLDDGTYQLIFSATVGDRVAEQTSEITLR